MECHHHHSGNRILIFHLPLRLVSRCFLAASRSQSIRDWPGFDLLNFSLIEVRREVPALAIVVSCLTESWCTAATNVYARSLIFCMFCGAIGTGGNGWIAGMADRIMARSGTGYQEFGFVNGTPANGLSSLSLLRLHFQSSLGSLTPWKVYLCNAQPKEYSLQCRVTQQVKSIILV